MVVGRLGEQGLNAFSCLGLSREQGRVHHGCLDAVALCSRWLFLWLCIVCLRLGRGDSVARVGVEREGQY